MTKKVLSDSDLSMITSCYSYSTLNNQYMIELREKYGDKIIDEAIKQLRDTYEIVRDVYTDSEGCTYNQLVKREA